MNNKKKQTVAVAMATALGVSAMMSPVTVYAQEDTYSADATKDAQPYESTPLSLTDDTFTDDNAAIKAIQAALSAYGIHNTTTKEELQDYLTKEFLDTGKLEELTVSGYNITKATEDQEGRVTVHYDFNRIKSTQYPKQVSYESPIPRLLKQGEAEINKDNFPDDVFREYVKQFDISKDGRLTMDEIEKVTYIHVLDKKEIKTLKGIEYFSALEELNCRRTSIEQLDLTSNKLLTSIDCEENKYLTSINIEGLYFLNFLLCGDTSISRLDISTNINLLELRCYSTNIAQLDVSKNTKLISLACAHVDIDELDVSKNKELQYLYCFDTSISSLDLSNNLKLRNLILMNVSITSLDVSHHPKLQFLSILGTNLAWIHIGNQNQLEKDDSYPISFEISDSNIDVTVTGSTFDITEVFEGIDPSKITIKSGAVLKGSVVSDYTIGTPIVYEYDCGETLKEKKVLQVTLKLYKGEIDLTIKGCTDMEYTGKPYPNPVVETKGNIDDVIYTYMQEKDGKQIPLTSAPTEAGTYWVKAEIKGNAFHNDRSTEYVRFQITRATNEWIQALDIKDWKEAEKANTPTTTAKFGDAVFTYSDSENGPYTSEVPTKAGTWYVKATVTGTANYTGLESIRAFTIQEQDQPSGSVQTGDNSKGGLLATLTMLSAGCIALLAGKKKRRT